MSDSFTSKSLSCLDRFGIGNRSFDLLEDLRDVVAHHDTLAHTRRMMKSLGRQPLIKRLRHKLRGTGFADIPQHLKRIDPSAMAVGKVDVVGIVSYRMHLLDRQRTRFGSRQDGQTNRFLWRIHPFLIATRTLTTFAQHAKRDRGLCVVAPSDDQFAIVGGL